MPLVLDSERQRAYREPILVLGRAAEELVTHGGRPSEGVWDTQTVEEAVSAS